MSEIIAPMAAKVFEIKVKPGDKIEEGEEVLVLEAMKMEMPIVAEEAGTVKEVRCAVGDAVEAEAVLVTFE
jgi:acetyl-CoA carboxylase biotin carboxyl carrier protein